LANLTIPTTIWTGSNPLSFGSSWLWDRARHPLIVERTLLIKTESHLETVVRNQLGSYTVH